MEINLFLQVVQFIVEILGAVLQYVKGQWGEEGTWQKTKNKKTKLKQKKKTMEERTSLFLCAAQDLHAQSDPAVPRPGKDPDEAGVDGRLYHVLSVRVVVKVPLEHLERQDRRDIIVGDVFIWNRSREQYLVRDLEFLTVLNQKKNMSTSTPDGFWRQAGAGER